MANDIPAKLASLVVTDLPKRVAVPGHAEPAPFWLAPGMFPGVDLRVAGLDASQCVGRPHAEPHVHDRPEIYLATSEERGSVVVRVEMDGETFDVASPFAVFIPPGVRHCFEVLRCDEPSYVVRHSATGLEATRIGRGVNGMATTTTLPTVESYAKKYPDVPEEVILKEDLLRLGLNVTRDAMELSKGCREQAYYLFF